jgi:hypothetical protein
MRRWRWTRLLIPVVFVLLVAIDLASCGTPTQLGATPSGTPHVQGTSPASTTPSSVSPSPAGPGTSPGATGDDEY